jgi:small conductance mechanosensitive channel
MCPLVKSLLSLIVVACLATNVLAQSPGEKSASDIQSMVETLNKDIASLEFLTGKIAETEKMEFEVLVYRQDERSFRLLADFDTLVSKLAGSSVPAAQKETVEAQLTKLSEGVGKAIINRINEIEQRINQATEKLESLSGGALIAAEAHIQSIETIRIKYYQALVSHLESRKKLGLNSDELQKLLKPKLHLFAETLAGRIELTSLGINEVQKRADLDPGNTDVSTVLLDLNAIHRTNVNRMQSIILVLDSLKMDSSEYKAVMLKQSGSLSISFFSPQALVSVMKDSWTALKSEIKGNAPDLTIRLLLFIAILLVFRILSRITKRVVRAASDRSALDMSELLKNVLVSTTGGTVMALGVLIALSQIGISLAPMLAGLGVAGFIVGFALQDSLGNFAAGAMILIYRPFDEDDFVEVTGASGLVKKMNLVSTTITTFDNQTLVVPNSKIWGDVIKNVTAQNQRRIDLTFGIGYGDDIEHAERVLTEIVLAHNKVLKDPEPNIKLHTLGDSSVNFVVRPWVKTDDYWDVYWDIMREVKLRFDREGISIPYPQRDVHLISEQQARDPEHT